MNFSKILPFFFISGMLITSSIASRSQKADYRRFMRSLSRNDRKKLSSSSSSSSSSLKCIHVQQQKESGGVKSQNYINFS
ncbi:unnamed protein product [Clavelina lepadiformis]|uniref:Secreted protein n=1 Tax=Clavelina lepadiformis TaxID=159417 RepID=A0ABP0H541_CLALP